MAREYDWSRFEVDFYYDAAPDKVFSAWATARGLESFFIKTAAVTSSNGSVREPDDLFEGGDHYAWAFCQPFRVEGTITECNESARRVGFTFGGEMRVSVEVEPVGSGSFLRLVQTGIPQTEEGRVGGHLNCRSCWVYFLTNLKSVLERGADLRDREHPERAMCVEVGFIPMH